VKPFLTIGLTDAGEIAVESDGAVMAAIRKRIGPEVGSLQLGIIGCLAAEHMMRPNAVLLLAHAISVLSSPDTGKAYGDTVALATEHDWQPLDLATALATALKKASE
jgi:hypothetical protein